MISIVQSTPARPATLPSNPFHQSRPGDFHNSFCWRIWKAYVVSYSANNTIVKIFLLILFPVLLERFPVFCTKHELITSLLVFVDSFCCSDHILGSNRQRLFRPASVKKLSVSAARLSKELMPFNFTQICLSYSGCTPLPPSLHPSLLRLFNLPLESPFHLFSDPLLWILDFHPPELLIN